MRYHLMSLAGSTISLSNDLQWIANMAEPGHICIDNAEGQAYRYTVFSADTACTGALLGTPCADLAAAVRLAQRAADDSNTLPPTVFKRN